MSPAIAGSVLRKIGEHVLGRSSGRFAVLIYHRVLPEPDPLLPDEMHRQRFATHLETLTSCFNVRPLAETLERSRRGDVLPGTVCITFDDGYADNSEVALPMLSAYGTHATFFIATGFLGGGAMWNDLIIHAVRAATAPMLSLESLGLGRFTLDSLEARAAAIPTLLAKVKYLPPDQRIELVHAILEIAGTPPPTDLMMTDEQIRKLHSAGMTIGGHTVNHPILASLPPEQARTEIADGRDRLQAITGERPTLFAYPNGRPETDFRNEHVAIVRDLGFAGAVTTSWGAPRAPVDLFQVPRFTPWDRQPTRFAGRLLYNALFARPAFV